MDHRQQAFKAKFEDAARHLETAAQLVVSLKLRDNVGGYQEYRELIDLLTRDTGLKYAPASGNLQGNGHLIGNDASKIILVEHETGLEILYIAGSVASLLGLIPMVLNCWRRIRGHMARFPQDDIGHVEIRRLERDGKVTEQPQSSRLGPRGLSLSAIDWALLEAAEQIGAELADIKQSIRVLAKRVEVLEQTKNSRDLTKAKTRKKGPKR